MKIIEADHERRYEIPGVPGLARKPVDIDSIKTGFTHLRSLRIYRFDAGVSIDGHAEEDEVFVVVLSGSTVMKIGWEGTSPDAFGTFKLSAPVEANTGSFVAYLPPHSVYQLTPETAADIAYARATPLSKRLPAVFGEGATADSHTGLLLAETRHAEVLKLRVHRFSAPLHSVQMEAPCSEDADCETLVHLHGAHGVEIAITSKQHEPTARLSAWQTAALELGESADLSITAGSNALVLTILAS